MSSPPRRLSLEDLLAFPRPGGRAPQQVSFLPDGTVAYLLARPDSTVLDLWRHDGQRPELWLEAPGQAAYSLAEELSRERRRFVWDGITGYQVEGTTLLAQAAGEWWLKSGAEPARRLPAAAGAEGATLLADGRRLVFHRQGELHLLDLAGDRVVTLTEGAEEGLGHGVAEFVAQEELGRSEGFWASPDGQWLALTEVDERHLPQFPIVHQGDTVWTEHHRYPFVGAENARVRLGVMPLSGGPVTWRELLMADGYLARAVWRPDNQLAFLVIDRPQQQMAWHLLDPKSGSCRLLYEESGQPWLNLPQPLTFLPDGSFLTTSERSGFRHLYHGQEDGPLRQLTDGDWMVSELLAVDPAGERAFIAHTWNDGLDLELSVVSLRDGQVSRISQGEGRHHCTVSPDGRRVVDRHDAPGHGAITTLLDTSGRTPSVTIHEDAAATADALGLRPPQILSIPIPAGGPLWAALYRPPTARPGSRYPLVVAVYGGPHAQLITRSWDLTANLMSQYLAQEGFFVLSVDGRGSAGRGLAHEAWISRAFGTVELEDQVAAVRWICEREPVDPDRVGIHGWSYGGFMTITALLKAPEVFRAGVAGAPVTDFRHYDTAYTERYMGTDQDNHQGYERAALPPLASRLSGELLIIHGMVDENVHFRHTARMVDALIAAGKPVELAILPSSRHSVRGPEQRRLVAEKTVEFFRRTL